MSSCISQTGLLSRLCVVNGAGPFRKTNPRAHQPYGSRCNDPYQIIQVFNKFDQVDQLIECGAKLTFSRMNNFGLTKTPFRRPGRYEFTDRLNVKIRLTDKKLWSW